MADNLEELLSAQSDDTVVWSAVAGYSQVSATKYDDADIVEIDHEGNISSDIAVQLFNLRQANSQYILFERERYVDGIDLAGSGMSIGIGYRRADGVFGRTLAVNVRTSDTGLIQYGWIVPYDATAVQGDLYVASNITGTNYNGDAYILTDLYVTLTVHDSVLSSEDIPETEPTWYESFSVQMANYVDEAANSATAAADSAESIAETVRLVNQIVATGLYSIDDNGDLTFSSCSAVTVDANGNMVLGGAA